jgi:hypothetical protein
MLLSSLSLLSMGCAAVVMQPRVAAEPPVEASARAVDPLLDVVRPAGPDAAGSVSRGHFQDVGDFVAYRVSGSYREVPVTITQKVVERSEGRLIVDLTIAEDGEQLRLRLRLDDRPYRQGQLLSVARLAGEVQLPFGVAAYDRLMSELVLSPDDLEAPIGSTGVLVDVGGVPIPAVRTSYHVRVGAHAAVMSTLASRSLGWGRLGGEIVSADGKLLYKAEIVDLGRAQAATDALVSASDDPYEDE